MLKRDRVKLEAVLADLQRVEKHFYSENVVYGYLNKHPHGLTFTNEKADYGIDPMEKRVGTEMCYLKHAIRSLNSILNPIKLEDTVG